MDTKVLPFDKVGVLSGGHCEPVLVHDEWRFRLAWLAEAVYEFRGLVFGQSSSSSLHRSEDHKGHFDVLRLCLISQTL